MVVAEKVAIALHLKGAVGVEDVHAAVEAENVANLVGRRPDKVKCPCSNAIAAIEIPLKVAVEPDQAVAQAAGGQTQGLGVGAGEPKIRVIGVAVAVAVGSWAADAAGAVLGVVDPQINTVSPWQKTSGDRVVLGADVLEQGAAHGAVAVELLSGLGPPQNI